MNEEKYTDITPEVKLDWNKFLIVILLDETVKLTFDTLTPFKEAVITPVLAILGAVIEDE